MGTQTTEVNPRGEGFAYIIAYRLLAARSEELSPFEEVLQITLGFGAGIFVIIIVFALLLGAVSILEEGDPEQLVMWLGMLLLCHLLAVGILRLYPFVATKAFDAYKAMTYTKSNTVIIRKHDLARGLSRATNPSLMHGREISAPVPQAHSPFS